VDDLEDFRKRVRRDDYEAHVIAFCCAGFGFLLGFVFENAVVTFGIIGCSLIASGAYAVRGGKSAVTRMSGSIPWTTRELEDMPPAERAEHANTTGAWLILTGLFALAAALLAFAH
jgi:hypothetical protein